MASAKDILNDPERLRWCRLYMLLDYFGKQILKDIFHVKIRAPDNGTKGLYDFLSDFKCRLQFLKSEEAEKVYPQNKKTDEENFDISLFAKVIIAILGYYHGSNQFCEQKQKQIEKDIDFTKWLRNRRNWLSHKGDKRLSELEFKKAWQEVSKVFGDYGVDGGSFKDLENGDIFSNVKYWEKSLFNLSQGRIGQFSFW